jgi:hypothetical protein
MGVAGGLALTASRLRRSLPDGVLVPSFGPRTVCTGCEIARPNWKD